MEYKNEEYPFYEYFYFSDYLNEKYITEKLNHMDENKYPVLRKYLGHKNNKDVKNNSFCITISIKNSIIYCFKLIPFK